MAIKMTCPCGKRMAIDKQYIGRKIACPGCGKRFVLDRAKLVAMAKRSRQAAAATEAVHADASAPSSSMPASLDDEVLGSREGQGEDLLGLLDDDAINARIEAVQRPHPSLGRGGSHLDRNLLQEGEDASQSGERPTCPSCGQSLPPNAKLCVQCGINIKTGRSIVTATDGHLDAAYITAERTIWWISWLIGFGMYPIASEAYGARKPHFIRGIAIATILISAFIWYYEWTDSPKMQSYKQLMLWSGNKPPDGETIMMLYALTSRGDNVAFENRLTELVAEKNAAAAKPPPPPAKGEVPSVTGKANAVGAGRPPSKTSQKNKPPATDADESGDDEHGDPADNGDTSEAANAPSEPSKSNEALSTDDDEDEDDEGDWEMRIALAPQAHASLPVEARVIGEYRTYQLLTNAFLHGGILHLVGNLLFLFVLGSRVNALIGNAWCALVYPLLAIIGSIGHAVSSANEVTHGAIGASGAIMGLAGMYLVLFPVHQVHMAAWWRWGLLRGLKLSLKIWPVRGFWVVLFYIAFDVFFTALGIDDGVAHWAHLGGFMGGVAIALLLLVTRRINARGTDIVSALLGRRAWAIIGKPRA